MFDRSSGKLVITSLFFTVIPVLIVGTVGYLSASRIASDKILESVSLSHSQLRQNLNTTFRNMENVCDSAENYLYVLRNMPLEPVEDYIDYFSFARQRIQTLNDIFSLFRICVFLPDNMFVSNEGLTFYPIHDLERFRIGETELSGIGISSKWLFRRDMRFPVLLNSSGERIDALLCCRSFSTPHIIQYALFSSIRTGTIANQFRNFFSGTPIKNYLLTPDGTIACHTDPGREGENIMNIYPGCDSYAGDIASADWDGRVIYLENNAVYAHLLDNGFYLVTEIPHSYVSGETFQLIQVIIIVLLLMIPVMIVIIRKNIGTVVDLTIREERQKYHALQAQINPHFLYNILGSIHTSYSLGRRETADNMIRKLTGFYRLILRKDGDLIPIHDELEIARLYLEIESLCRQGNLTWDIKSEDGIEHFLIGKFTLQPVLENSLRHGLVSPVEKLHIGVTCAYGDDTVIITIADNGAGMTSDRLAELQARLRSEYPADYEKHIGLYNVYARISNPLFGSGRINIESVPGEKTVVTIEFKQMG